MQIVALQIISQSELLTVEPKFTEEYCLKNKEELYSVLYDLGMDTNYPLDEQNLTHRNRFENIVTSLRWVGNERTDKEWIESGYATYEAKAKASGNRILTDLFRMRGLADSD